MFFWSVPSKASLTIDIEDPVCGRVVSSIISVGEGNASREGMLGNAKHHGTHFSVDLQGHHPRERTSGILARLVYTHTHTKKRCQNIARMMAEYSHVAVCV